MSVKKVDQPPEAIRENIRNGGLIRPGDRVAVVSVSQGERIFVVTEVDDDNIRGEGLEMPIDDVVALEKRSIDPVRTGLAIYSGYGVALFALLGAVYLGAALGAL
ncbi:MAG: hypothetical protein OXH68_19760 [Gammaproteobacteria bacterium]|nr:hypothetical protein [Gammaproteobacteria bacterium]